MSDKTVGCRFTVFLQKLRDQCSAYHVRPVIPYSTNQCRDEKELLGADKYFRAHGPIAERRIYRKRAAAERLNSRLKDQVNPERPRIKGLRRITVHALLCMIAMLLNALAALRLNRLEKVRSIASSQDERNQR